MAMAQSIYRFLALEARPFVVQIRGDERKGASAMSQSRSNPIQHLPEAYAALSQVEAGLRASGLDKAVLGLVKMRASQINGCAFCLDMHSHDARAAGETEQRLYLLNGWREAPVFTDREKAALAWCEHLTRVASDGAPDAVYDALRPHFSDTEIANLTLLVGMINLWNRIVIGSGMQPQVRR
jgi:AhpD family alkylhydroperoxidase